MANALCGKQLSAWNQGIGAIYCNAEMGHQGNCSCTFTQQAYAIPPAPASCSEVVERLAECADVEYEGILGSNMVPTTRAWFDREKASAILHSWRERRVQELEHELLYIRGLLWKLRNTAKSALTDAKFESDEYLAKSEQIRKGAK